MPSFSADEVVSLLDSYNLDSPKVLILGYSYKPETGDIRDTPVLEFSQGISSSGVTVFVWDPFVEDKHFPEWVVQVGGPLEESGLDMVILATAHSQFMNIDWEGLRERCNNPIFYDGRRALSPLEMKKVGWEYFAIGYPTN